MFYSIANSSAFSFRTTLAPNNPSVRWCHTAACEPPPAFTDILGFAERNFPAKT